MGPGLWSLDAWTRSCPTRSTKQKREKSWDALRGNRSSLSFSVTDRHVVLMGKSVSHPVAVGRSRDALGNTTELRVISCDDTTNGLPGTRLDSRQLESSLFRTLKTELTSNDRAKTEE